MNAVSWPEAAVMIAVTISSMVTVAIVAYWQFRK
jgi:hypothetical protein